MSKQFSNLARLIIVITSIGHLIFANIHVKALLLLEHELCGFYMFIFVLMGLITLFEATRIRPQERKERVLTSLMCLVTCGMGLLLSSVYRSAIATQRALDIPAVSKAVMFSTVIVAAYVISGILIAADLIKNR